MPQAIKAAVTAVNSSGGIGGRPLQVDVCDAQSPTDPNPVISCLRKVTADQGYVAEVGDYSSFGDVATPIENTAHLVQIGAPPNALSQQTLPNAYPLVMPEEEAFGAALVKNGVKNPGLLYIDVPTAAKAYSDINAYLKAAGSSVQLTKSVPAPLTSTDLSPQTAALCGNDGVALSLSYAQIGQYLSAHGQSSCTQQKAVTAMIGIASTLPSLGAAANGLIVDSGLPLVTDTSNPGVQKFIAEMKTVDPNWAKDVDEVSESTWLSIWAFAQEARLIKGTVTRDAVWNHWSHITSFQVFGMLPPGLNLQQGITQVPNANRVTNHWIQIGTVQNGAVKPDGLGWVDVLNLASS
jgi:ABC-type branched-subunit amino acid transport system substrate-binding protein